MSSKVVDSIRRGLEEAAAYTEGKAGESAYRIHVPERIDVKAIRTPGHDAGRIRGAVKASRL